MELEDTHNHICLHGSEHQLIICLYYLIGVVDTRMIDLRNNMVLFCSLHTRESVIEALFKRAEELKGDEKKMLDGSVLYTTAYLNKFHYESFK